MAYFKWIRSSSNLKTLKSKKHKQIELFIADSFCTPYFRDDVYSMEHPFFALRAGDTNVREYKNGNVTVTVVPSVGIGMATIFDKDIWIYAISKLQQAMFEEKPVSPTIQFSVYDFLTTTNRSVGGRAYEDFLIALKRLKGTTITTCITVNENEKKDHIFSLIEEVKASKTRKGRKDITMIEITLPNWLYEEVTSCRVLKISPDYFRIRKAVNRRIYEIARKHCGASADFHISLEKLQKKTGATSPKEKFRFNIKQLSKTNDLPDYEVLYDVDTDMVTLKNRDVEASKKYEESLQSLRHKKNREALANKQQESTQSLHYDIDDQQLEGVEREEAISRLKKQRDEIITQFSSSK